MRKLVVAGMVLAFGWLAVSLFAAEDEKPKHSIKDVMKVCMKGGLCAKVAKGEASDEDKAKLVECFTALAANKPPKGEEESWKAKTDALLSAAKAAAEGKDGAGDKLKAAANCMECHKAHKG
jgi:hypothetical protein